MPFRHICQVWDRAPGVVDLLIDNVPENLSFDLDFSQTFGGSYGDTVTIPQGVGGITPSLNAHVYQTGMYTGHGMKDKTRFLFNPADIGVSALDDNTMFWVQVTVNDGPSAGAQIPYPVVPKSATGHIPFVVQGTAPNAASIANSLQVMLPSWSREIYLVNNDTVGIWLGFEPNGDETFVPAQGTYALPKFANQGISRIFVRGDAATADFSFTADLNVGYQKT